MEYEKYYNKDFDGLYNLHFVNKDRLGVSEIKNIFSLYGKVLGVNFSKDEGGFVFIKYKSEEDTIRCLKALKDSSEIQILPERKKINMNKRMIKRDSNQQQESKMGNSFRKSFSSDEKLNSNFVYDKNLPNRENLIRIRTSTESNGSNNFSDTNYQNPMHKSNLHIMRGHELDLSVFNEKFSLPLKQQQTSTEDNSSDSTIDYEKYYKISRDGYTVHFVNKKKLSLEEINELFSLYGNILSVQSGGGNNGGLRFVTYKTLEEVIKCLKGLQNSNVVTILRQKDKMGETKATDQRSSNYLHDARIEDTSQRTFNKQFYSNSIPNESFPENGEKSIHYVRTCDLNKLKDNVYFSGIAPHNTRQGCKFNEIRHANISPRMFNEKYSLKQNFMNNEDYNQVREKQQKTKLYSSTKTEKDVEINRNMEIDNRKMPALISKIKVKSKESDVMSNNSLSNEIRNPSSKIAPMQEIIVANIHVKYGIHYILHLFERHDPISATLVKTIPENDIRYCHVYFKTIQDAVAVEEEFDNFDLSGRNLIVLRKSRLIDETA